MTEKQIQELRDLVHDWDFETIINTCINYHNTWIDNATEQELQEYYNLMIGN